MSHCATRSTLQKGRARQGQLGFPTYQNERCRDKRPENVNASGNFVPAAPTDVKELERVES